MYHTILMPKDMKDRIDRAILQSTHYQTSKKRGKQKKGVKRAEAQFNTKSYNDALQRAFNNAKAQVYFNPDMRHFVTLTYRGADHDINRVMDDLKVFLKTESRAGHKNIKYIWVAEYQKRGSIHVHLITNNDFETFTNKNGYLQLTNWKHGFSSFLTVNDFDENFRPHLYLFKYMRKAQRIGKSFLHSSRNLNNFEKIKDYDPDPNLWDTKVQERTEAHINDFHVYFYKYYLERAKLATSTIINTEALNANKPTRRAN